MNALFVIKPYKSMGMWVFDDEQRRLNQEPFVGGADTLIDRATADIPDAENGFALVFSQHEFPGATIHLTWRRAEMSGNTYWCEELQQEAWLCPALLKFFEEPPAELFAKVQGIS
ncbi:MAG: hypothetical protein KDC26_05440 [Armatimonadetes bacterium]|nr:hypothetical protein [Armatimonadota bacterium]